MNSSPRVCPSCGVDVETEVSFCPSCGADTTAGGQDDMFERVRAALSGEYDLLRELGRGGMAIVYLADDLKHQRKVAVKVMRPELTPQLGIKRFLREIETSARLNHPHILPVLDSGTADGFSYYVMPCVAGETLRDRLLRETQLPLDEAIQIIRETANALAYAHSHGVLHRDIKPENILLEAGVAVVSDFGISLAITAAGSERLTETGLAVGTPAYMSPEQSSGEKQIDARSDIYSLGCVLYEMLVGEPPYTGPTSQAVLARKMLEPVPTMRTVRETVPDAIQGVVTKALARVPADRFQTATEFADTLGTIQRTSAPLAVPQAPAATTRARLIRKAAWIAAAFFALAGAFVVGRWRFNRATGPRVSADRLVVYPFAYHGDETMSHLGGAMVNLLSTVLDGVGAIRTVDPSAVLGTVDNLGGAALDPERAAAISERFGAGRYITGSIVQGEGGHVNVTAVAYDLTRDATQISRGSVEGNADRQLFRLVNELAVELIGGLGITESPRRLESLSTGSIAALNEYLRGEAALHQGDFAEAADSYRRAVDSDSLFALGWYRLAYAQGFTPNTAEVPAALSRALDFDTLLSERDRRLAEAYSALTHADATNADQKYRALVSDYPDDVEAWFGLADVRLHFGPVVGLSMDSIAAGFRRVLQFEPQHSEALSHLPWAAVLDGDLALTDSATAMLTDADPAGFFTPMYVGINALAAADSTARRDGLRALAELDDLRLLLTLNVAVALPDLDGAYEIASLLTDSSRSQTTRALGYAITAHLEAARGRRRAAGEQLTMAAALDRSVALEHRAALALLPFLDVPRDELEALRDEIGEWDAPGSSPSSANPFLTPHAGYHPELRIYLLGLLSAQLDDSTAALGYAEQLEGTDPADETASTANAWAHSIRAAQAMHANRPADVLRELDEGGVLGAWERASSSPFFSQSYERYLRARALEAMGRDQDALRWYASLWMQNTFDQVYRAESHLRRGYIYDRAGDTDRARDHFQDYLRLWGGADPDLTSSVQQVRRRREGRS